MEFWQQFVLLVSSQPCVIDKINTSVPLSDYNLGNRIFDRIHLTYYHERMCIKPGPVCGDEVDGQAKQQAAQQPTSKLYEELAEDSEDYVEN